MKRRPGDVGLYFFNAIGLDLSPLEDLDRVALAHLHDGLLPAGARALRHPAPLRLRLHLDDVHVLDVHLEQLLHGLADLRLVRVLVDLEGVLAVADQAVALLGDDRREQHLVRMEAHQEALPWTSGSAASLIRTLRAQTIVATSSSEGTVTSDFVRLRKDLISVSSSSVATTSSGKSLPQPSTRPRACFVDGVSNPEASRTPSVPFEAWFERAPRSAERRALRLTFTSKLRMPGAKTTPPPVNWGA